MISSDGAILGLSDSETIFPLHRCGSNVFVIRVGVMGQRV